MLFSLAMIQFGLGISHANPQDCGIWYMCGQQYSHNLTLDSPDVSLGLKGDNWRAGLEYLGRFASEATAISSNNPALIPCAPQCYPISRWNGAGKLFGFYTEYVYRIDKWHIEAGPWVYRATWTEDIPDYWMPNVGRIHVNVSADSINVGAVLGGGYDFGRFGLAGTIRMASDRGPDRSIVKGFVSTLQVTWTR
jgi:hypothetical protein